MDALQAMAGTALAPLAADIAASALDGVELVPRPDEAPPDELGATRFGGLPDLPAGVRWPRRRGEPLTLLLQLDLRDAARFPATRSLPAAGWLWFFYDVVEQPWGYERAHRTGWRVLHAPDGTGLRRREAASSTVLPAVAVRLQHVVTYPGSRSESAVFDDDTEDLYRELVLGGDRIRHLLLGHPDPIQRDPVGSGCVSLLQLDSDPLLGTIWGDSGKLHWTIPERALSAQRFDATWMELQCC